MIVHLVLFRPRPDLTDDERDGLLAAMREAAEGIPSVRGFRVGQHIANPVPYVISGFPSFPWVALVEFDDEAGLRAYLGHPLHVALGQRFNAAAEAAMIYDYGIAKREGGRAKGEGRAGRGKGEGGRAKAASRERPRADRLGRDGAGCRPANLEVLGEAATGGMRSRLQTDRRAQ